jgi:hypothetical protein
MSRIIDGSFSMIRALDRAHAKKQNSARRKRDAGYTISDGRYVIEGGEPETLEDGSQELR